MSSIAGTAAAASKVAVSCLDTPTVVASTSKLVDGLGLTPDQVRAARARLSQYGGYGYQGLDGIGLTPDQIAQIQQRLAAAKAGAHPAGWPCAPFTNRARVIQFVRAKLVYNGFRPAMQFFNVSARQVRFNAIQDGIEYFGVVAKTGPRRIAIQLSSTRSSGGGGGTFTFNLTFSA